MIRIQGCKKSDQPEKAKSARRAFNYIDKLQEKGVLTIEGLDLKSEEKAYADPKLIERIIKDLKQDKTTVFLTEDKDLKIRLRYQLKKENLGGEKLVIFSHDNMVFLELFTEVLTLENEIKATLQKLTQWEISIDHLKEHCPRCNKNILTYTVTKSEGVFEKYSEYCCECGRFISEGHNG
ncbi:MAG: hypothetical protein Q9N67_00010 [Ghiorsea sp.]|nr:hypothetical protein [Ghiorsea sp.]